MGIATLCTAKKRCIYRHGDTVHCPIAAHKWAWGHFALLKSPICIGIGTLCTTKKHPINQHGDTAHYPIAARKWAWGHFALLKCPICIGMGTLCIAKKPPRWAWEHFVLPGSPRNVGMRTLCTVKNHPMHGQGDTSHCQKACFSFLVLDAQGVIECTRENPGKLKVHLCKAQVHLEAELTGGPCIMLA